MHENVLIQLQAFGKSIVNLIANPNYSIIIVSFIVNDCKLLVFQLPKIRIGHCFRDAIIGVLMG